MGLAERIDQLEPRERQLLLVLVGIVGVFVLLFIPVGVTALVSSRRSDVEELQTAINDIQEGSVKVRARQAERDTILARYAKPAPPLAGFLAKQAESAKIEIPESQDRATVPHGKLYEERSTKIVLRKVGMLNLVKFLESVEQSGYPVSISKLNIRKRGTEDDSYDVEMHVSAYDRKEKPKPKKSADSEEPDGEEDSE